MSDLTTIRTVDLTTREVRTIAGDPRIEGYVDGTGMSARFRDIGAIWGDGVNIYVGDRGFVRKLAIATNEVTTFAEVESPDGIWGGGGRLYVIDVSGEKLKEFDLSTGQARDLISPFPRPTGTTLPRPFHGIWTGGSGDVYLADPYTHVIRKMNVLSGEMTIIAGKPLEVSFRDGILSEARFSGPAGIWGDGENLYLADAGNHVIRKIDLENRIVSTIAGNPNASGNQDGVGSAARFDSPSGIWGNGSEIYVTDPVNDNVRRISLRTGEVTTVAVATRPSGLSGNGQRVFFIDGLGNIIAYDPASEATTALNRLCFPVFIRFTISTYCSGGIWANSVSLGFTLSEFRRLSLTTGAISGNAGALFPGLPMSTGLWSDGAAFYGGVGSEVVQHTLRGFQRLSFAGEKPSFGLVQGIWGNGSVLYVTDRAKNTIHTITPAPVPTDRSVLVRGDSLEVFESYGSGDLQAGRIHYVPESGPLPFATAVVSRFESGIRASSTTLKGTKAITAGRIPIRQGGSARTGLSLTNPNSLSTTITFYYTDAAGQDFGRSSFTLASFCSETRKRLKQQELTPAATVIFRLGACVFAGILRFSAPFSSLRQRRGAGEAAAAIIPGPDQSIRRRDREDGGGFAVADGLPRHRLHGRIVWCSCHAR